MTALKPPAAIRLDDPDAERARRNHDERIDEVQRLLVANPPGAGRYFGRKIFSASGVYTPNPGARQLRVRMVGGGGGGGGSTGGAGTQSFGGGGCGGAYVEAYVSSARAFAGGAVAVGAGGAGGAGGGGAGGQGGNTTIAINGVTYTATGGGGALGMGAAGGNAFAGEGGPVGGSGVADTVAQQPGTAGVCVAGPFGWTGHGGGSPFGAGGPRSNVFNVAGQPGGTGGGGGGSASGAANAAGGPGGAGLVIVDEWGA